MDAEDVERYLRAIADRPVDAGQAFDELFRPFGVGTRVGSDAEYLDAPAAELRVELGEIGHRGAARRAVDEPAIEHNQLAAKIFIRDGHRRVHPAGHLERRYQHVLQMFGRWRAGPEE